MSWIRRTMSVIGSVRRRRISNACGIVDTGPRGLNSTAIPACRRERRGATLDDRLGARRERRQEGGEHPGRAHGCRSIGEPLGGSEGIPLVVAQEQREQLVAAEPGGAVGRGSIGACSLGDDAEGVEAGGGGGQSAHRSPRPI